MALVRSLFRYWRRKLRRKLLYRQAPRGRGPAARLVRRILPFSILLACVTFAFGFTSDVLSMRQGTCSFSLIQPAASDLCGALGVPGFPTRSERLAWEALPHGNCDALRTFLGRFPNGARSEEARARLRTPSVVSESFPSRFERIEMGYVRYSPTPFPAESLARSDVERRAQEDSRSTLCQPREPGERTINVVVTPTAFDCQQHPEGGHICSLDYRALCQMEVRRRIVQCE